MAENKTQRTETPVAEFIAGVEPEGRRKECEILFEMLSEELGDVAIWGTSMVGASEYIYKYPTGREGRWFCAGFAPRKSNLTIYLMGGYDKQQERLAKLGKHKLGQSCLYVNKLSDIDLDVLREMIRANSELIDGEIIRPKESGNR
jgi:hypothetical protein